MIPSTPQAGKFRFRMIGGGLQLQISKAEDIANVLLLDDALWAMTSVDTDSLRFDRRFLEFVDSDHDGMPDEWEKVQKLNPNDPDDRNLTDKEGWTNLERYLNGLVHPSL